MIACSCSERKRKRERDGRAGGGGMRQRRKKEKQSRARIRQTVNEKGEKTKNRDHSTRHALKLGVRKNRMMINEKRRHAKYK